MKNARALGLLTSLLCVASIFLQSEQEQRFWKIVEVALEMNLRNRRVGGNYLADLEKRRDGMYVVCRGERE